MTSNALPIAMTGRCILCPDAEGLDLADLADHLTTDHQVPTGPPRALHLLAGEPYRTAAGWVSLCSCGQPFAASTKDAAERARVRHRVEQLPTHATRRGRMQAVAFNTLAHPQLRMTFTERSRLAARLVDALLIDEERENGGIGGILITLPAIPRTATR